MDQRFEFVFYTLDNWQVAKVARLASDHGKGEFNFYSLRENGEKEKESEIKWGSGLAFEQ